MCQTTTAANDFPASGELVGTGEAGKQMPWEMNKRLQTSGSPRRLSVGAK